MSRLNCGIVSSVAWPILRRHVAAAVKITDLQALEATGELRRQGVNPGPCVGSTLAALKVISESASSSAELDLNEKAKIILIISEGPDAAVSS